MASISLYLRKFLVRFSQGSTCLWHRLADFEERSTKTPLARITLDV